MARGVVEAGSLKRYDLYVDGTFQPPSQNARFESVNPYTEEPWATVADASVEDLDVAVDAALRALEGDWLTLGGAGRGKLMHRLADLVEQNLAHLAAIETSDNGKVRRDAEAQVALVAKWLRYFAGLADKIEGRVVSEPQAEYFVYTRREPVGVVGAILPWNAPLLLLAFKLAPALAAGCTMVVKPSEFTPASVLAFAQYVHKAGFPAGVFNVVSGSSRELGAALAAHPRVSRIAFTGSTQTGISVSKAASDHVGRVTLELGGKSPQIVFADADLEAAVNGVVAGVFAASGQMCHAGSRVLVEQSIHDAFVDALVRRAREARLGDPTDPLTDIGPISTEPQLRKIEELVSASARSGAKILCGGKVSPRSGYFFEPTVITNVQQHAQIVREEVFGPVVAVMPFDREDDAIEMANDTPYGLAAGLWTSNLNRAHRMVDRIKAGTVWVNCYRVASPAVPFGGMKTSGVGRENGLDAINDYLETKSVWMDVSGGKRDPYRISSSSSESSESTTTRESNPSRGDHLDE